MAFVQPIDCNVKTLHFATHKFPVYATQNVLSTPETNWPALPLLTLKKLASPLKSGPLTNQELDRVTVDFVLSQTE